MSANNHECLGERDIKLIVLLAGGYTTAGVAAELHLSRYTVAERISTLLALFGCDNRSQLVAYCYAHGLLPIGIWPPKAS